MSDVETPAAPAAGTGADVDDAREPSTPVFISPVAMENDPDALFAGDRGTLDAEVRRVLVRILQRRFLLAGNSPPAGKPPLEPPQTIELCPDDPFVGLRVGHTLCVASTAHMITLRQRHEQ